MAQPDAAAAADTPPPQPPLKMRHDQFFKDTFADLAHAAEFFQRTLPPEVVQAARWSTLELLPVSFIDADLDESEADLLYLLQLVGQPTDNKAPAPAVYLYVLFEHQSTTDWNMPFRLLKYIVEAWDSQEKGKLGPRPILPVLFHQQNQTWKGPRSLWKWLCGKTPGLEKMEFLRPWVPDFRHEVLEVVDMADLARQLSLLLGLRLGLMKAATEDREMEWLKEWEEQLTAVAHGDEQALRTLHALLSYCFSTVEKENHSTMRKKMEELKDEKLKGEGMSLADALIREGEIKGEIKGETRGKLVGTIRTLQLVLSREQTAEEELGQMSVEELGCLSGELMALLHGEGKV